MKLVTKAKRFMERMEMVEQMTEREMVQLLFRANEILTKYVETEDKKELAYNELKKTTTYKSIKIEKKESKPMDIAKAIIKQEIKKEVIEETIEEVAQPAAETKLVITSIKEEKGFLCGVYHIDNQEVYFSSSDKFSHPVVFGNAKYTASIKEEIINQLPEFYHPVTKNFKELALFGKIDNQDVMVYLADNKRQAFSGYVGNMVFSTTKNYIEKGYNPLVTVNSQFIENGGEHNHVTNNACTPKLKKIIVELIQQYTRSAKYIKACCDKEYINKLKEYEYATKQQEQEVVEEQPYNYGYGFMDIEFDSRVNPDAIVIGDGEVYAPEF